LGLSLLALCATISCSHKQDDSRIKHSEALKNTLGVLRDVQASGLARTRADRQYLERHLKEAVHLAQRDEVSRKPFLYLATYHRARADSALSYVNLCWLKKEKDLAHSTVVRLHIEVDGAEKRRTFDIPLVGILGGNWHDSYDWGLKIISQIVDGRDVRYEIVDHPVVQGMKAVFLEIGREVLTPSTRVWISDRTGNESNRVRLVELVPWGRGGNKPSGVGHSGDPE